MAVELQTQEKTLIAILSGEIDHHCAQPMLAEIDAKIGARIAERGDRA